MKTKVSLIMAALVTSATLAQPAQAQASDPLFRALLGVLQGDGVYARDTARRGGHDDDDDGYRRGRNDDDDDGYRGGRGRDDDDDDGGRGGNDDDD